MAGMDLVSVQRPAGWLNSDEGHEWLLARAMAFAAMTFRAHELQAVKPTKK